MKMALLLLWYVFVLGLAVALIPFSLSCFPIWQLLTVWPFILSFIGSTGVALIGFSVPHYLLMKEGGRSAKKL
jgi:hypothetical protein